jgi:hypothetical protein
VDGPLVPIKGTNEIVAHIRPLALARLIAVGARHPGAAAQYLMLRIPRLIRVVLAHPPLALTTLAIGHWLNMGAARGQRQQVFPRDRGEHKVNNLAWTRRVASLTTRSWLFAFAAAFARAKNPIGSRASLRSLGLSSHCAMC